MSKKNMRRISILVTAQTAKNLERLGVHVADTEKSGWSWTS